MKYGQINLTNTVIIVSTITKQTSMYLSSSHTVIPVFNNFSNIKRLDYYDSRFKIHDFINKAQAQCAT
jgi:hypothetical protein